MKAVNLLPSDLRSTSRASAGTVHAEPEAGGPAAFVVLGALALCVAALAAYVLTTNTVEDRRVQLATVTAEAQAAAQRAAALKPYADFDAMAKARVQTVRDLAASRFDWEQGLRDISLAIPANVTLTSMTGSVSSQSGAGGALRGAIPSPAIELQGCTTDQPAVATLMSRLRAVDGVTRVSLSRSANSDAGTGGAGGIEGPCGAGVRPSFELVLFFERSEVPATVEDITVAPQAAPATADGAAAPAAPADPAAAAPAEGTAEPVPAETSGDSPS